VDRATRPARSGGAREAPSQTNQIGRGARGALSDQPDRKGREKGPLRPARSGGAREAPCQTSQNVQHATLARMSIRAWPNARRSSLTHTVMQLYNYAPPEMASKNHSCHVRQPLIGCQVWCSSGIQEVNQDWRRTFTHAQPTQAQPHKATLSLLRRKRSQAAHSHWPVPARAV